LFNPPTPTPAPADPALGPKPPTAQGRSYTASEDTPLTVDTTSGVLSGASDLNNDALTALLVKGPSHGSLDLKLDGSFTYTPAQDFNDADSFDFEVLDGSGGAAVATATITVGVWLGEVGVPRSRGLGCRLQGKAGPPSATFPTRCL
jgi:hypothetical protein